MLQICFLRLVLKGSAEELIKQELQAVAEGVVASVFQSGNHSPDSMVYERNESAYEASQDMKISSEDIEVQHKAKFEVLCPFCSGCICLLMFVLYFDLLVSSDVVFI